MAITGAEMSKCFVKGCDKDHKNLNEHYADIRGSLREGEKPILHEEAFKAAVSKGVFAPDMGHVNNAVVTKSLPNSVTNKAVNNAKVSVNNGGVTESVTNKKDQGKLRAAKWRKDHREKYNSEMRELMQNIRAKAKFSHLESMDGDGI